MYLKKSLKFHGEELRAGEMTLAKARGAHLCEPGLKPPEPT